MTEQDDTATPDHELRGMLAKRLLVAGGLVAALLAVLAFFDYLVTPDNTPEPRVFSEPVPVPPKKGVSQPVTPMEPPPEPPPVLEPVIGPPEPALPPPPEVAARPEMPVVPVAPVAEPPKVNATPAPPAKTPTRPASQGLASTTTLTTPSSTAPTAQKPVTVLSTTPPKSEAQVLEPVPAALRRVPDESALQPKPPVVPVPAANPEPVRPATVRVFPGYVVQAGVFSTAKAAEELHAKLTLNGIPSTIEARVQVGPFKNRKEADAARQKLKALGIESLMIPPAKRR